MVARLGLFPDHPPCREYVMTLPNTAPTLPAKRRRGGTSEAALPAGSLQRSLVEAGSRAQGLEPILRSSAVRVQVEALERLEAEAEAQQRAFRRELRSQICA
jgi:hypothetical protein